MLAPEARLAPNEGVLPAPRKAVPAPESNIEKGAPDWKMVSPLIPHPPKTPCTSPEVFAKKGRSYT